MTEPTPTPLTDATVWLSDSQYDLVIGSHVRAHGCGGTSCVAREDDARVVQSIVIAHRESSAAAARADERKRITAALIDAAPPINFGMSHDGREDPLASAYVEGWHDAWATLAQPADTETYCGAEFGEVREGECECPHCLAQPADTKEGDHG